MPVLHDVLAQTGLKTADIGFTCSGSSDYLAGRAFSFIAVGALFLVGGFFYQRMDVHSPT